MSYRTVMAITLSLSLSGCGPGQLFIFQGDSLKSGSGGYKEQSEKPRHNGDGEGRPRGERPRGEPPKEDLPNISPN